MEEEKDEEKKYNPVGDFFKGVLIGGLILFGVIFCSIFLFPLLFPLLGNIFWGMMIIIIVIQIALGVNAWIRWKRKFFALGLFFSLPIVTYIYYSICGSVY